MVSAPNTSKEKPETRLFKLSDTDLDWWIEKTEASAKKHLNTTIDLRKRFMIPTELSWESVIPVFDPGNITNRDAVELSLKTQKLAVWEETDVIKYSGGTSSGEPTLKFIRKAKRPNEGTMGKLPDQLRETGMEYLTLRGYALAFGLYYFAISEYL